MLTCPGCGGRNPPDAELCPFCNRRLGEPSSGARARRARLVALVLVLLAVGLVAVFLSRAWSLV